MKATIVIIESKAKLYQEGLPVKLFSSHQGLVDYVKTRDIKVSNKEVLSQFFREQIK